MANKVKCFNIVKAVTDEASNQLGSTWTLDVRRFAILKQYCEAIDNLASWCDAEAFEVEVDDILLTISIAMECPEITVDKTTGIFFDLLERSLRASFSTTADTGALVIRLTFPSVWVPVA